MGHQRLNQKKTAAPARSHPTKTSIKSPVHPVEELQGAIGNREMGRLMETNRQSHPSSPFPKLQGELPLLGGMMPVSQGTIQRQPLFRGLSEELTADTAMALPATGAVIQPKLTLGTPGDMYEEEADRVARQVVDEIHSSPFREPNTRSHGERKPEVWEAGRVQRQLTVRAAGDAGGELSSEWQGELQRAKSGGQPLSPTVKEPMEQAFGVDFGGVRVHTGAQADRLARSIQAKAFTTGQDVFFRQGAYEPGSRGGKELIVHELTHVVQQSKFHHSKCPKRSLRRAVTKTEVGENRIIQRETHIVYGRAQNIELSNPPNPNLWVWNLNGDQEIGTTVEAKLDLNDPVQGSGVGGGVAQNVMNDLAAKFNQVNWVLGHMLNSELGGLGITENLVPITHSANQQHYYAVEREMKRALYNQPVNVFLNNEGYLHYRARYRQTNMGAIRGTHRPEAILECSWRTQRPQQNPFFALWGPWQIFNILSTPDPLVIPQGWQVQGNGMGLPNQPPNLARVQTNVNLVGQNVPVAAQWFNNLWPPPNIIVPPNHRFILIAQGLNGLQRVVGWVE